MTKAGCSLRWPTRVKISSYFTGISADQINAALEGCFSRQKVLILDCCYSGAFPLGRTAKADEEVHAVERFRGRGRVVLTASDATSYSFDGAVVSGSATQSVFTRYLIEGLESGSADMDGDGDISLDELYSYVYERVTQEMPQRRPKKQEDVEGRIVVARNVNWTLPTHLQNSLQSPLTLDRLSAVQSLGTLIREGNSFVQAQSLAALNRLVDDDSRSVSAAASEFLSALQARSKQVAGERVEREVSERAERETRKRADLQARERAEREARERADLQARERAERKFIDQSMHGVSGAKSAFVPSIATVGGVGMTSLFISEHSGWDLANYPAEVLISSFVAGGLLIAVVAIVFLVKRRRSHAMLHGVLVGVGSYYIVESTVALWSVLGSGSWQWYAILFVASLLTACGILAERSRRERGPLLRPTASWPVGVVAQAASPPTSFNVFALIASAALVIVGGYRGYVGIRASERVRGRTTLLLAISILIGACLVFVQWSKSGSAEGLAAISLVNSPLAVYSAGWTLVAPALSLLYYVLAISPSKGGLLDPFCVIVGTVYLTLLAFSRINIVGLIFLGGEWQYVVEGLCYAVLAVVMLVSFKLVLRAPV